MGRKLRHVLIFLLIILKEPNMPEAVCDCLQEVFLENNKITTIYSGAFANLPLFQYLQLKKNNMSAIPLPALDLFLSVIIIELDGNPWQCDCRMGPVRLNPAFKDQIICAQPAELQGQKLKDVNPEKLVCEESTISTLAPDIQVTSKTSYEHWYFESIDNSTTSPAGKTIATHTSTPTPAITSNKPESAPSSTLAVLIGSICGPLAGIVLIVAIVVTVWYKRRTRQPPLGPNSNVLGGNRNTTATVLTSDDDNKYEDIDRHHVENEQGQPQTDIESNTNTTATAMTSSHDQTGQGQSQTNTESTTNTTATVMTSSHDQTGQGQSQADIESNTNTTATVMASGEDHQYEYIDNHHVEKGQGQSQTNTESNTNTTATVMTSGHGQTGQGQSQTNTESNTNTTTTVMTSGHGQTGQGQSQASLLPLKVGNVTHDHAQATPKLPATMGTKTTRPRAYTKLASSHDQSGQGQSQAITESNTNTTATVMVSGDYHQYEDIDNNHIKAGQGYSQEITESSSNTAAVMTSDHDQTGQGHSQANTEAFDARNLCYDTGPTGSQLNSLYKAVTGSQTATVMASVDDQTRGGYSLTITESSTNTAATVMTSGHDQTGKGQSHANTESPDARNSFYGTEPTDSQINSLYKQQL
ncbi:hypothetical protein Bbelb_269300 [Branchiostoma belcheri]|nr:hypothetical protein Bbelb_269300 [Branchiostoma belcheri]